MILLNDWTLKYNKVMEKERLGEQIDVINTFDAVSCCEQLHGFSWQMEMFNEGYINHETGIYKNYEFPFIITLDVFYFKELKYYHKFHFTHSFIILGYNAKTKKYNCLDPYFDYAQYEVTYEEVFKGVTQCGRITLFKRYKEEKKDFIEMISKDTKLINENYVNVKRFAYDISNKMNIDNEFHGYKNDLYAVPLTRKLHKIAMYRKAYAIALNYVCNLYNLTYLQDASNLMMQSVYLWTIVSGKVLKAYFSDTRRDEIEIAGKIVEQIADIEKNVVETVLKSIEAE